MQLSFTEVDFEPIFLSLCLKSGGGRDGVGNPSFAVNVMSSGVSFSRALSVRLVVTIEAKLVCFIFFYICFF